MVTTTMNAWRVIPDIIGDGVSEQHEIMTAICETKGATYDGTDCAGELDDSTVHVSIHSALHQLLCIVYASTCQQSHWYTFGPNHH